MNTRMVTLVATIAVIALVAVGIGYAYQASTTNTANSMTVTYITMTPSAGANADVDNSSYTKVFSQSIEYNTSTAAGGTITYTPLGVVNDVESPVNGMKKCGATLTLTIDKTHIKEGDHYKLSMTDNSTNSTMTGTYKVLCNGTDIASYSPGTGASNFYDGDASSVTVELYVATGTVVPLMNNITFTLTAEAYTPTP